MPIKSGAELRREQIRENFFPTDDLWMVGLKEIGWFSSPRTLPLILSLIDSKPISGTRSASRVYVELLSRHRTDGIIEMANEAEHAYASGYEGSRAVRSWQERMQTLEENGFIRAQKIGNERYKYVGLVHPTTAIQKLREADKVPEPWWAAYVARKLETKELTHDQRIQKLAALAKVIPISTPATPFTTVPFPIQAAAPPPPPTPVPIPAPVPTPAPAAGKTAKANTA